MKQLLKNFFLMVAVTIPVTVNADELMNHSRSKRTVGGVKTSIIHVPYQVSIELDGAPFCGGSIIAKHWIITAAHCMTESKEFYEIRAGSSLPKTGGSAHTIRAIIKRSDFAVDKDSNAHNDIALINVNEPFKFDQFRQPINLVNDCEITPVGSIGFVSGFTRPTGNQQFENLHTVVLKAISKKECQAYYKNKYIFSKEQFCAHSPENGNGPCYGDSGSAFVINSRVHGIVSWGVGCGLHRFPDVFIKIAPYRHWIDDTIKKTKAVIPSPNGYVLKYHNPIYPIFKYYSNIYKYPIVNDIKTIYCRT